MKRKLFNAYHVRLSEREEEFDYGQHDGWSEYRLHNWRMGPWKITTIGHFEDFEESQKAGNEALKETQAFKELLDIYHDICADMELEDGRKRDHMVECWEDRVQKTGDGKHIVFDWEEWNAHVEDEDRDEFDLSREAKVEILKISIKPKKKMKKVKK